MACGPHKKYIYYLKCSVQICAKQKPLLKFLLMWWYNFILFYLTIEMHIIQIGNVCLLSYVPSLPLLPINKHMCVICYFNVLVLDHIPCMLTFKNTYEWLYLLHQFGYKCHYEPKIIDETLVNLCHIFKQCYLLWVYQIWHVYDYIFLFKIRWFPFPWKLQIPKYSWKDNESTFINIQVNTIGIHPTLLEAYF
jgi:hypothetical protein